jgi:tRNA(adenine34) deaminase
MKSQKDTLDNYYMMKAMLEAEKTKAEGDVPVGAVVVHEDKIVGRGYNQVEKKKDSTAHAEIIAIRQAIKRIGYKHLLEATLYVTLEPCAMCAGAIVLSRVNRIVYGTNDPKAGACGSVMNIVNNQSLNHRSQITSGILEKENSEILKEFFREIRKTKKDGR